MKPTKETLETLRVICIKNWNMWRMNPTPKNCKKHLKATTNYNRVFGWLDKNGYYGNKTMKPTKETLETLRGICLKNWNIYCMNPTTKNWEKHLKATTNYNRVFTFLEKQGYYGK